MTRPSVPLPVDLAEAVEQFAQWRRTRLNRSEPTPRPLRERAVALLAAHRPSTVARVLGINTVMLERWSGSFGSEVMGIPSHFVALPDVAPESVARDAAPAADDPELVLRWPGGAELIARGAIPPHTLCAILEAFAPPPAGATSGTPRR